MSVTEATTTLKVYEGGNPAHAQVFVDPDSRVVDYLDADGNVLATNVHDAVSIDAIAARVGADVVVEKLGQVLVSPSRLAANANRIEVGEAPFEDLIEADTSFMDTDLNDLSVDELKDKLRELELPVSGKKDELIERLVTASSGE